jgi:hypothetical protein
MKAGDKETLEDGTLQRNTCLERGKTVLMDMTYDTHIPLTNITHH